MRRIRKIRLLEFLAIGLAMGMFEDLIAIRFATEAKIDVRIIWIVFVIALPFAFLSEIIVDNPYFWRHILPPYRTLHRRWLRIFKR